jgi:hypothetical protein
MFNEPDHTSDEFISIISAEAHDTHDFCMGVSLIFFSLLCTG